MSFFRSMLGGIAGRSVLPLMGVAGIGAYKSGTLSDMSFPGTVAVPSHYEMQARVTDVDYACRLRIRTDGKLRQTEVLQCDQAIDMLGKPSFAGFTLHKTERVQYSYYSMDGKSTLIGTLDHGHDGTGRSYRQNDVINIRVDSSDHSSSEVI